MGNAGVKRSSARAVFVFPLTGRQGTAAGFLVSVPVDGQEYRLSQAGKQANNTIEQDERTA